jgi:hypothetical protein
VIFRNVRGERGSYTAALPDEVRRPTMPIAIAVLSLVLILGFVLIKRRKRPSTMSRAGVTLDVRRFK